MSQYTDKHKNDLKLLLGSHVANVKTKLPKWADEIEKRIAKDMQQPFEAFLDKTDSIRSSGRYSPGGERAERQMVTRNMQEKLAAVRADTVTKIETKLAADRAAALKPKTTTTDPTLLLLRELRLRELRDHLRTLDPLTLQVSIRQAVDNGADTTLLDALEGAPTGFPIAPVELIAEARATIALKSHPELGELAQLRDAYAYAIGVVEQSLLAASGLTALELSIEPAPVG